MSKKTSHFKFSIGGIVMTPGIELILPQIDLVPLLQRHASGDWGDLDDEDKAQNTEALSNGTRIFSSYNTDASPDGKIWVITEADRSVTTFLLPSEY